jgi:hypothetical protein
VVGSALVLVAAAQAGSVALTGFGLDSVIEIAASSVVVWQLRGDASIHRERTAVRLIGFAFLLLAVFVVAQAAYALTTSATPDKSWLGVASLSATVAVMLTLALAKLRVGRTIRSHVLTTEAHVTLIDAYLAAAVLAGLLLNAIVGWWWADPLAALAIVGYAIREARLALWARGASGANSPLAHSSGPLPR